MFSLRTTSIKAALVLLCLGAASAAAQINPNQINWPSCSAGQSYVPYSNACVSFAPLASPAFTGTVDASVATQFKLPVGAGYTSAASGEVGYDSTNKNWHLWQNGADQLLIPLASGFTSGDCGEPKSSGGAWTIADAGSACGSAGGLSGMTSGQVPIAASATTVTSSKALAGSGSDIVTGPASATGGDLVVYTGSNGGQVDSGIGSNGTQLTPPIGSAASPPYSFSGSTGTGIYEISGGSIGFSVGGTNSASMAPSGVFTVNFGVSTARIYLNSPKSVVSCATSGTVTFSEPFQGTAYKAAIAYANACVGAATYTYETPFANPPEMQGVLSSIGSSTTTVWTVTGATSTGWLKADGY